MKKGVYRALLLCLVGLAPTAAIAAAVFAVPASDKSMQYLGMVFGTVGTLPILGTGNPLFGQLMYIFNQIIFALGLLLIIMTTVMGTISTAQEGEIMGKKFSSIWVPIRAGIGMYLLLPTTTVGYNWVQVAVMWLIIQGVGAANALWEQVVYSNQTDGSVVADTRAETLNEKSVENVISGMLSSVICMQQINEAMLRDPSVAQRMDNEPISVYQLNNTIRFGRMSKGDAMCGSVDPQFNANNYSFLSSNASSYEKGLEQSRKQAVLDAIFLAETALEPPASEAINDPNGYKTHSWTYFNSLVSAARVMQQATQAADPEGLAAASQQQILDEVNDVGMITDAYRWATGFDASKKASQMQASVERISEQAIADGWIHAGAYYFQLVSAGKFINTPLSITTTPMNTTEMDTVLAGASNSIKAKVGNYSTNYWEYAKENIVTLTPADRSGGTMMGGMDLSGSASGVAGKIFGAITGGSFFTDLAVEMGKAISTGCLSDSTDPNQQGNDPIVCMATFGATVMTIIESMFWATLTIVFGFWIATSVMSCSNPLPWAQMAVLIVLIPMLYIMILLLWGAAASLGIYVPLIPFFVFTFAALSWLILVIEAMVAAPLIALVLLLPSEDELGKAAHAMVILLGLVLRPALMILGFIFGIQLLIVAVGMLNYGFSATMNTSIPGGMGIFAFIAIFTLYTGIAVSLVHECFTLIHVLPDKVLRWMGARGESTDVSSKAKELEGYAGKGAKVGEAGMQAGTGKAGTGMKNARAQGLKNEGGKGGASI